MEGLDGVCSRMQSTMGMMEAGLAGGLLYLRGAGGNTARARMTAGSPNACPARPRPPVPTQPVLQVQAVRYLLAGHPFCWNGLSFAHAATTLQAQAPPSALPLPLPPASSPLKLKPEAQQLAELLARSASLPGAALQ